MSLCRWTGHSSSPGHMMRRSASGTSRANKPYAASPTKVKQTPSVTPNTGTSVALSCCPHFLCVRVCARVCARAGPVTNAIITAAPANMFLPDSRPAVPLPRFSRHLNNSEGDGRELGEVCVRLGLYTQVRQPSCPPLRGLEFSLATKLTVYLQSEQEMP